MWASPGIIYSVMGVHSYHHHNQLSGCQLGTLDHLYLRGNGMGRSRNESNPSTPATVSTWAPSDTTPPSIPAGLKGTILSSSEVVLSWEGSTDNVQVAGYQVMRNNVPLRTTIALSYHDSVLSSGSTYTYTVAAFDEAGNVSLPSDPVNITPSSSTSTLSVSIVGSGTVASSPTGILCSNDTCSTSYATAVTFH